MSDINHPTVRCARATPPNGKKGAQTKKKRKGNNYITLISATEFHRPIHEASSSSSHSSLRVLNFIEIRVDALHERGNLFSVDTPINGRRAGFRRRHATEGGKGGRRRSFGGSVVGASREEASSRFSGAVRVNVRKTWPVFGERRCLAGSACGGGHDAVFFRWFLLGIIDAVPM